MQSIAAGNGSSASGDPCTASRATFIIPNPCPASNTTLNTTVSGSVGVVAVVAAANQFVGWTRSAHVHGF
jgi:hypothetical protein